MWKSAPGSSTPSIWMCWWGMITEKNIYWSPPIRFFLLSGRTACRWKYDSCDSLFRDLALLCVADASQIPYIIVIWGLLLFYLEKNKALTAPLLNIHLVLRLPDTISPIPTPCPSSYWDRLYGLITTFRALMTKLKYKLLGPGHLRIGPLWNSSSWPVLPWFC